MSLEHSPARQGKRTSLGKRARGPPAAQTIPQFCDDHGISKAYYFLLRKRGLGPDELRPTENGQLVLITAESAAAWRKKFTRKGIARPRQRAAVSA
jgi:hypothetical protein